MRSSGLKNALIYVELFSLNTGLWHESTRFKCHNLDSTVVIGLRLVDVYPGIRILKYCHFEDFAQFENEAHYYLMW